MNEFTVELFTHTTAEDQDNYFSGSVQIPKRTSEGPFRQLADGVYRIIDGELCAVEVGLSPDEVKHRLDIISKK